MGIIFKKKTLKKAWKTLGGTLKNTKKDLENLEKTLKNAPKIAGTPENDPHHAYTSQTQ